MDIFQTILTALCPQMLI
uniref:ATSPS1F (Sucrose phosphate synthase 1F) n=1 Tax=Arundo donax TaxID=35708 RepID=A0A0A9FTX0_ARUDO